MTTPTDPEGTGASDDLPYLPPARPAPEPPVFEPPPPSGTELPPNGSTADSFPATGEPTRPSHDFDARELVEAQRWQHPGPAYGSLPAASEGNAEAVRQLRTEAQRRRRRNARLGWIVAVVVFAAAVIAGWLAYRAFDDDQRGGGAAPSDTLADVVEPRFEPEPAMVTFPDDAP